MVKHCIKCKRDIEVPPQLSRVQLICAACSEPDSHRIKLAQEALDNADFYIQLCTVTDKKKQEECHAYNNGQCMNGFTCGWHEVDICNSECGMRMRYPISCQNHECEFLPKNKNLNKNFFSKVKKAEISHRVDWCNEVDTKSVVKSFKEGFYKGAEWAKGEMDDRG